MIEAAIKDALVKLKRNIRQHSGLFPYITQDKRYEWAVKSDWIEGFHSGLMWLAYQNGGDHFFKDSGKQATKQFAERAEARRNVETHDLGFLYSLSAAADYKLTQDLTAKSVAIRAADLLMKRWRPEIGILQAWGPEGDPDNGGRMIVDTLMNLPLLFWASKETGVTAYYETAYAHARKALRYLQRGDGSTYHTFYFDPLDGEPLYGRTHQGATDGSTWARGQAWAIYGFALVHRYTGDSQFLEGAKQAAKYYMDHLPGDFVAYWDLDVEVTPSTPRDSSASAIALCGLLELKDRLSGNDPFRELLGSHIEQAISSLINNYSTMSIPEAEGLLQHGSYHVHNRWGIDDYMIWGDYFYLEGLMKLKGQTKGFW